MVRPRKCRMVSSVPGVTYFKPAGIPMHSLEEVILTVEELESVRLKDLEGFDQTGCAEKMGVSRTTFSRILDSAREKIASALVKGKAIQINGGDYQFEEQSPCCCRLAGKMPAGSADESTD